MIDAKMESRDGTQQEIDRQDVNKNTESQKSEEKAEHCW